MTFWSVISDFLRSLFSFDQAHPLLFTQFYFWAFLFLVFAGFSLIGNRILLRNTWLFISSIFFYYKTSGIFVFLLLFVITFNFFSAKAIARARRRAAASMATEDRGRTASTPYLAGRALSSGGRDGASAASTFWMVLSVIIDLSILAYFKYAYFLADVVGNLLGTEIVVRDIFGMDAIILPVGISFFTFQAISYVVDVKRGRIDPVRNYLDFGFYLSFFPQLVAGPIVRATEFASQLHKPFNLSRRWFGIAVFWIMNGLLKKIILSDYLAVNLCDRVFAAPMMYSGFENLAALFCYSLQVYADFSGYTDIAIGVALLMGFYLPKNFNSPYKARNAGEFWKRWHMTLSNWLKDYLYIPLGGNRNGTPGTWIVIFGMALIAIFLSGSWVVALVIGLVAIGIGLWALFQPSARRKIVTNINSMNTMLLGGLWHGASWNFVIWGGLNGLGMIVYKIWKGWNVYVRVAVCTGVAAALYALTRLTPAPAWNLFYVWMLIILAGAFIRMIIVAILSAQRAGETVAFGEPSTPYLGSTDATGSATPKALQWLDNAWAVLQTFIFITFTRLFFRSGSNLDPAQANEEAWQTATGMVHQIGSHWDLSLLGDMMRQHAPVLILFVVGMLIHWLPERFKRRYRLTFSALPLPVMALVVVLIVAFFYQFITADLQSFIYFQF